jgi:tetratricopeptide (TPR) repeat protein
MRRNATDPNRAGANGHKPGYVEKHLVLLKQFWSQLRLVKPGVLEGVESPSADHSPDPQVRACHHLLWGVFHYNDGDMILGHDHLSQAEQLLQGMIVSSSESIAKNDLYAYALCELAVFYYRLFDMKHTWDYLSLARSFALSKPVRVVIDTIEQSFRHNRFFMDVIPGDMSEFDACLDYLRRKGIDYWLIVGLYYRMALNVALDRLDQTLDNYLEGSELSRKLDLDTFQSAFQMALGIWYANHKEWQTALKCYNEAYDLTLSPYRQALCLENTASLYDRYPNHEKRMDVLNRMLHHCERHNITQKVPVVCQYFAKYYLEQIKDLALAKYYYKKGYDAAIELQDHGLHLFSRLATIVREYPEFIEKYYYFQAGSEEASASRCLEFCLNRDWRSMKHTFQHALLLFHRGQAENGAELMRRLKLKPSTLHAIRAKLSEAGFDLPDLRFGYARLNGPEPDPALAIYCQGIAGLDWKAANLRFQADALGLLLKHNHYNKLKLSRQLKISYPTAIKLLKAVPADPSTLPVA